VSPPKRIEEDFRTGRLRLYILRVGFFMYNLNIVLLSRQRKLTLYTAKTQYQKFETGKGIARPQSQFPHSCVCGAIYVFPHGSIYSAAGKYVD
jgi:hypothetical protein